jgi:PAS domain S-box-containing protein
LNRVLLAIRNVSSLIIQEKENEPLIKKICENLVEIGGYKSAWILLVDEDRKYKTAQEAGLEDNFISFMEELKHNKFPTCIQLAFKRSDPFIISDSSIDCSSKSIEYKFCTKTAVVAPIRSGNKLLGVLVVCFLPDVVIDEEELTLLKDVVNDISYALYNIDIRKEHEKYEAALVESEERYRTIFDSSSDAINVRDAVTGELVEANIKMLELFDYDYNEISKIKPGDFSIGIYPYIKESYNELFRIAASGYPQTFEWLVINRKSRIFWVEVSLRSANIKGRNCVLTNMRDITERKESEEKLKESEENYRTIFNFFQEAIIVVDRRSGIIIDTNRSITKLGYSINEIKGKSIFDFIRELPGFEKERALKIFAEVSASGKPYHIEWPIVNKDKETIWIEVNSNHVVINGRECIIANLRDVTRKKLL